MIPEPAAVAVGGAAGAAARYLLSVRVSGRRGTLVVNTAGSTALGVVASAASVAPSVVALVGVGFCGAFTTFSSVAVETQQLLAADDRRTAAVFVGLVVVGALVGAVVGQLAT